MASGSTTRDGCMRTDINSLGIENLGKGLGTQIIKHTKKSESKNNSWSRL